MIQFGNSQRIKEMAFQLRREIFVMEQKIPVSLEFDETPSSHYFYFIYTLENVPLGTLRFQVRDNQLNPDRLCVKKTYRNKGIGRQLLLHMEKLGVKMGFEKSILEGEIIAASFYEKLGYEIASDIYLVDGVPVYLFEKNLK